VVEAGREVYKSPHVTELDGAARSVLAKASRERPTGVRIIDELLRNWMAADAAADAAAQEQVQETGGGAESARPSEQLRMASTIAAVLEKLARRRASQPPGEVPRVLRAAGLPPLFWAALDAKGRHWLKRRCDSIKADKLVCKAVQMGLQQVQGALAEAGVERAVEDLMNAVEAESLLFGLPFGQPGHPGTVFWEHLKEEPAVRRF